MCALIIREPWITRILAGEKTWEIRGSATSVRGRIGLIRAGSGLIVGTAQLVGCEGPLDLEALRRHRRKHLVEPAHFGDVLERYTRPHAWVLANARRLPRPIPVLGRGASAPLLETRTRELYAIEKDEKLRPVEKTVLYADWPEGVALVGITETQEGRPPRVLRDPVVEMPRTIRADTTWRAGEASARVAGLADVTVAAGDYARCVVIEEAGGYKLPDGRRTDVRRRRGVRRSAHR